ncbi:MAG: hypothetical protein OXD36_13690 [Rhodobacter sp.]|nr:hypothetical protein [Rhodobacter sp.]
MRISKLYMPAVTLAGALALAGCGGGSDSPGTGGGKSQAQLDCEAEEGTWSESTTPMCTPQSDGTSLTDTVEALVDATDALEDLAAGADADDSALKVAREAYVKSQSAIMLKGVSADVQKYAEMVIAARDGLEDAIEDAEGAQEKVETARDGFAETDSQYVLLTREIEKADAAIKAANALLAPGGGIAALAAEFPETGDNSPAKRADSIAGEVLDALGEDTTEPAALPTGDTAKNVFASDSTRTASMRTFAQLFAGATTPQAWSGNTIVNAISLKGEPAADGTNTLTAIAEGDAPNAPAAYIYRGIAGMAACRKSSGCELSGANLGEGWYFYPTNDEGYFTTEIDVDGEGKVTTTYASASFAEWGMWLALNDSNELRVNRFVGGTSADNVGIDVTSITASSAKYSGTATGLSARKTGTEANAPIASGHFLADVDLRATFGNNARLTGDIDNFRAVNEDQGSAHVNSDWKLDLISAADAFDDGIDDTEGTLGVGADGSWFADAYGGSATKRPVGIVGGFDANFDGDDDGEAAGVFHAIK